MPSASHRPPSCLYRATSSPASAPPSPPRSTSPSTGPSASRTHPRAYHTIPYHTTPPAPPLSFPFRSVTRQRAHHRARVVVVLVRRPLAWRAGYLWLVGVFPAFFTPSSPFVAQDTPTALLYFCCKTGASIPSGNDCSRSIYSSWPSSLIKPRSTPQNRSVSLPCLVLYPCLAFDLFYSKESHIVLLLDSIPSQSCWAISFPIRQRPSAK